VALFKKATEEEGKKVFGMMVVDEEKRLYGMLSMYDILLFMRPKHIHMWGTMDDVDIAEILKLSCKKAKSVFVGDIMTPDIVTVTPQTHILMILDIMIKKHIRRLPVLEGKKIKGIIYISDLFYELFDILTQ
jgi:CBS domain-containing protein